jgi:hypothetical protein
MQKRIGCMRLQQPHPSGEAGGDARRRATPCRRDSLRRTHPGFQDRLPSAVSRRSGKGWRHGLIFAVSHPFGLAAPDLFRAHGLRAVGITWPRREGLGVDAPSGHANNGGIAVRAGAPQRPAQAQGRVGCHRHSQTHEPHAALGLGTIPLHLDTAAWKASTRPSRPLPLLSSHSRP